MWIVHFQAIFESNGSKATLKLPETGSRATSAIWSLLDENEIETR
jgi:hypothetical protein